MSKLIIILLSFFFGILVGGTAFFFKEKSTTSLKQSSSKAITWRDDFNSLNTQFWNIPDREALEGRYRNVHTGYFEKDNVTTKDGYLILKITQEIGVVDNNAKGVLSKGSEIESKKTFGYGTYQWRVRMSSISSDPKTPGKMVSGQISALFNFINNSETEIDFEVEGQYPEQIEMVTWKNPDTSGFPTEDDRMYTFRTFRGAESSFHTYKFVWTPKEITYFIDDTLVAHHTDHVPTASAHFMINHWGTNSKEFGGEASVGTDRYMLVDWVSYDSLQ